MRCVKLCGAFGLILSLGLGAVNGYAAQPEPVLYGIGSVSKMYTTVGVMKLVEEGNLSLDAPLTEYLLEFSMADERYRQITLRMLLNHSSGLQGSIYTNSMTLGGANQENHRMILERLKKQRLKADPGSFSVYCNDGFTLAELVIERVTGLSYTDYIQNTYRNSLGIRNLETPESDFDRDRLAGIYMGNEIPLPYESTNLFGSGGLYSTAEDVCRFFRIFTKESYEGEAPFLTEASVKEMGKQQYQSEVWKPVALEGSSVAYGLGWDSVEEYPFNGYGVKAWSKGGDTTKYHASVTVLPEENISCAVVVSGGSSMAASLAVQSILQEYLVEKGRIEEVRDTIPSTWEERIKIPDEIKAYEGWYASGRQMMEISMGEDWELKIRSYGTGHNTTQIYHYQKDGSFQSTGQNYLSLSGDLLAAEGGAYGKTALRFEKGRQDQIYITMETIQYQPGMGTANICVPFAQKLQNADVEKEAMQPWEAGEKEEYLLTSEAYNSACYIDNPTVKLFLNPDAPGYVGLRGMTDSITKIKDGTGAEFFQQIPGHSGRDLNDIAIKKELGISYLENQNFRFRSAGSIPDWKESGDKVTMTDETQAQWYQAESYEGQQVCITAPDNGHFYIYRTGNNGLILTASSMTGDSGRPIYLPKSCKILLAGKQGAEFIIK